MANEKNDVCCVCNKPILLEAGAGKASNVVTDDFVMCSEKCMELLNNLVQEAYLEQINLISIPEELI